MPTLDIASHLFTPPPFSYPYGSCYSGTNKKTRKTRRARAVPPFYLYFEVTAEHNRKNDIPGLRDDGKLERKVPHITGDEPRAGNAFYDNVEHTSSSITISHLFDSLYTMSNSTC